MHIGFWLEELNAKGHLGDTGMLEKTNRLLPFDTTRTV
jgi:hypothetical protein